MRGEKPAGRFSHVRIGSTSSDDIVLLTSESAGSQPLATVTSYVDVGVATGFPARYYCVWVRRKV